MTEARLVVAAALVCLLLLIVLRPPEPGAGALLAELALFVGCFAATASALTRRRPASEALLVASLSAVLSHDLLAVIGDAAAGLRGQTVLGLALLRALLTLGAFVAVARARVFRSAG